MRLEVIIVIILAKFEEYISVLSFFYLICVTCPAKCLCLESIVYVRTLDDVICDIADMLNIAFHEEAYEQSGLVEVVGY